METNEVGENPLNNRVDDEFGEGVMAAPVIMKVNDKNVNNEVVCCLDISSVNTAETCECSALESDTCNKQDRKRGRLDVDGDELCNKRAKRCNQIEGESAHKDAISNILKLVENLSLEVQNMNVKVFDRMDSLEKTFAKNVVENITKLVDCKIDKVRKDVALEIEGVKTTINKVEEKCAQELQRLKMNVKEDIKREVECASRSRAGSYANAVSTNAAHPINVVIKNLPEKRGEKDDSSIIKANVEGLIRDGLRLRDVKVTKAVRKGSNPNAKRPGLIVATLETTQQRDKVMEDKHKLKSSSRYNDVFIEHEKTKHDLKTDQNLRTIVKEMGRERDFFVSNGQIKRRVNRDRSQDRARDHDRRRRR
ncbi:hypothetical protein FSP39_007525 [Pinctada imbricata]|uniref:Uncharacterized protein n=1 Tax=Pinctada imbricata TaxID=66713 RepID=A0AA89BZ00_PINIB|nr:hypothetical protein FSP39_007525 [Pinctada imbricata]